MGVAGNAGDDDIIAPQQSVKGLAVGLILHRNHAVGAGPSAKVASVDPRRYVIHQPDGLLRLLLRQPASSQASVARPGSASLGAPQALR